MYRAPVSDLLKETSFKAQTPTHLKYEVAHFECNNVVVGCDFKTSQ